MDRDTPTETCFFARKILAHTLESALDIAEQSLGFFAQHRPRRRKIHAARRALEQFNPQAFLDPLDLPGNGALRQTGDRSRLREALVLSY